MFKCNSCDRTFEEPVIEKTTYESLYGVASQFPNGNSVEIERCPYCDSDDIDALADVSEEDWEDFQNWCEQQNGGKEDWDAYAEYLEVE